MTLRTKIAVVAATLFLAGCQELPGYFASDTTLARAGGSELKMRDVESVVPKGVTGEDSAAFMKVYVDRWVRKQLKLQEAEILFSASADDIDKMVEEIGKPKFEYEHADFNEELFNKIVEATMDEAKAASWISITSTAASTRPSRRTRSRPITTRTRPISGSTVRWSKGGSCSSAKGTARRANCGS